MIRSADDHICPLFHGPPRPGGRRPAARGGRARLDRSARRGLGRAARPPRRQRDRDGRLGPGPHRHRPTCSCSSPTASWATRRSLELKQRAGGARVVLVVGEADTGRGRLGRAAGRRRPGRRADRRRGALRSRPAGRPRAARVPGHRGGRPAGRAALGPSARRAGARGRRAVQRRDRRRADDHGQHGRSSTCATIFRELGIHNRVEASRVWADMQGRAHPIW